MKKRYLNKHTFINLKIKQDHEVIEGTVSANWSVEGEGDVFWFDGYMAQILVSHRQFT
jgi:hypothetical protein